MIDVPFMSQWDLDAHLSPGDCGTVCVAMVCQFKGLDVTSDQLVTRAQLPVKAVTYSFGQLIRAASAAPLKLVYKSGATWEAIRSELDAGRPTITLLRYGSLNSNQDSFRGPHFVVVVGYDDSSVIIHDPDFSGVLRELGAGRRIPINQFKKAIGDDLLKTGNQAWQSLFLG